MRHNNTRHETWLCISLRVDRCYGKPDGSNRGTFRGRGHDNYDLDLIPLLLHFYVIILAVFTYLLGWYCRAPCPTIGWSIFGF